MVAGFGSSFFYPHTVVVASRRAGGGGGGGFGSERTLRAEVKDQQRMVRTPAGDEKVSTSRVTVELSANVAPGDRVTVWPGGAGTRRATVLAVERQVDAKPLPSFMILHLE